MNAEILAIGSELLTPGRLETNAAYLTARLLECGIAVGARVTVADDATLLTSAFRVALGRAELVAAEVVVPALRVQLEGPAEHSPGVERTREERGAVRDRDGRRRRRRRAQQAPPGE